VSKHLFRLRDIGHAGVWRILHGAHGQTAPEAAHEGLKGAAVPLLFAEHAPRDRLALTFSIRSMGGGEVYFGPGEWPGAEGGGRAAQSFIFGRGGPLCVVSGLGLSALEMLAASGGCPLANGGGPDAHPCRLLADMALMREKQPDLSKTRIAWVGGANGLAHSLIEAAMYIPFELFMALPEWGEPDRELLSLAFAAGAKIFLTRDIPLAVDGAHYVYAGSGPPHLEDGALRAGMLIDGAVMDMAGPESSMLLGHEAGCRVQDDVLAAHADLECERFAVRLKVQRLIWNWLLRENDAEG
jgi:ornithine carbamoyltransferase